MKCINCGSTNDVIDFYSKDDYLVLCVDCRYKLATGQLGKVGRPSIGVTKKVSLTLSEDLWNEIEKIKTGEKISQSELLRTIIESHFNKQNENIEDWLADSRPVGSPQGDPLTEEKTFIYEIDEQQKKEIKRLYDEGYGIREIMNITGVAHKVIRDYLSVHYGERFFCVKCDKFEGTIHMRDKKGGESPFCIDCGTYAF